VNLAASALDAQAKKNIKHGVPQRNRLRVSVFRKIESPPERAVL
jgi:hypothetical protein